MDGLVTIYASWEKMSDVL